MKNNGIDIEWRFSWREADMHEEPALQAADLVAWCVNRRNEPVFDGHRELSGLKMESELLDDAALAKPDRLTMEFIRHCKISKSAATP
jgi:hypothetical protein